MNIPPCSASIEIADIRLAGDFDIGVLVILVARGSVTSRSFVGRLVAGRSGGGNGQKSSDDELNKETKQNRNCFFRKLTRLTLNGQCFSLPASCCCLGMMS